MNLCRQKATEAATARRLTFGQRAISAAAGVLTVLLVTLLLASPTHAGMVRALTGSITGAGASLLSNPTGVAADSTAGSSAHDIYVTDPENHRVEKFGPSGNFILSFGEGVDQTTGGDVCPEGGGDVCQAGVSDPAPGGFQIPTFISVDNSVGGGGDVYVGDTGTGLVQKFTPSGTLIQTWGDHGELDGSSATGPFAEPFGSLAGIAVDLSGNLWVANDNSTYFEFARSSTFTTDFNELACCNYPTSANGLAVDSYSHLYFGVLGSFIEKISTSGSNIGEVTPSNAPTAFAIASTTNDFYDADSGGTEILHFRPSCALSTEECTAADSFGTGDLSNGASGLAVDSLSNVVYAAVPGAGEVQAFGEEVIPDATTGPAENLQSTSATVSGQVNPDGRQITECEFEFGETESYGGVKPCAESPAEIGGGAQQVAVHADLSGLSSTPGRTYHYRLVASNANGVRVFGLDHQFSEAAAPTIDGLSSANLSATTADLRAQINSHGADTTYQFEYGSSVAYGSSAPATEADAGSIDGDLPVEVELNGLQPGVTYHFRVIARNALGSATSQDQTFNFFPPNCPNITLRQQTRTSYLPDCRAYELVSPGNANGVLLTEPEDLRNSPLADNTFVYGGIAGVIPGTNPVNDLASDAYAATRTNSGWVTSYIGIPGNETSTDETRATDLSMDRFLVFNAEPPSAGLFSANISNAPYVYDSKGNRLARWPGNLDSIPGATEFAGQVSPSPDFSHLAFSSSNIAFTNEGLTTAPGSAYDFNTLSNTTSLISLTASGENILQGESIGFPGRASWYPGTSTNGSHILMSAGGVLYMRVNDALSYDVSRGHAVGYVDMTPDGSKVYFTSAEQLTPDDHDTSVDLYMWSEATDSLTRISGGNNDNGNSDACNASWISGCDVLPVVGGGRSDRALAANGDIYFYSPEQLDGSKGTSGQVNLYDYRDGQAQFVAALAPGTGCEHHPFEEDCGNGPLTRINVSPDDGHAAFLTSDPLTSYNNTATNGICSEELISGAPLSGPRCQEMYTYEPATGKIECASCNQSGAPPVSDAVGSEDGRFMTDDGRVFFYTLDALVPRDTNQKHDVYEYVDGRPQLITTGTGSQDASVVKFAADSSSATAREAGFSGVTADGEDVYFSTYNTLIGQDENGNFLKFYDARTDGGFPFIPPPAPCQAADECHGPGSPAAVVPRIESGANLGNTGNLGRHRKARHHRRHRRRQRSGRRRSTRVQGRVGR